MNKFYYLRLAVENFRRNREIYFPYLLASGLMIMVYHTFSLIANNPGMENIPASVTLNIIMTIGIWVGVIFSVIFIFYANSFLMKRRKKEFGLYGILGLEKQHVARMIIYETGIAALCAIGGGIIIGTVFSKLSFLILLKMIHVTETSRMIIQSETIIKTALIFLIIFIVTAIFNLFQVNLARPMDLMQSKNKGEREPKGSLVIALIGFVFTGIGYYIALTLKRNYYEFGNMLIVVLLVMIGTYCLFIAGSIKVLRMLRRSKKIYYKPDNFISISGLIYRLRQNAVGLSSICIICTMILITMSVTICLQIGGISSLRRVMGVDLSVGNIPSEEYETILFNGIKEHAPEYDIKIGSMYLYPDQKFGGYLVDGTLISSGGVPDKGTWEGAAGNVYNNENWYSITLMSAADYERITGESADLQDGHGILICAEENWMMQRSNSPLYLQNADGNGQPTLRFYGYGAERKSPDGEVQPVIDETIIFDEVRHESMLIDQKYNQIGKVFLILKDFETVLRMDNVYGDSGYKYLVYCFDGSDMARRKYIHAIQDDLTKTVYAASFTSLDENLEQFYIAYGGLVFVGILIALLFLLAMVLIIYYKQMSEGMEDREKYRIMVQVGIDESDVKKTIRKQVQTIFFVPLVVAIVHTAAAFKLTINLLSGLMYLDYPLFIACTGVVVLFVTIVYLVVYAVTANVYYRKVMTA